MGRYSGFGLSPTVLWGYWYANLVSRCRSMTGIVVSRTWPASWAARPARSLDTRPNFLYFRPGAQPPLPWVVTSRQAARTHIFCPRRYPTP